MNRRALKIHTQLFRIYTESSRAFDKNAIALAAKAAPGFTVLHGLGYWEGKPEKSLIIEVLGVKETTVTKLASAIRTANRQACILVTSTWTESQTNGWHPTAGGLPSMSIPKFTQKHFRDVAEILRVHFNRATHEPRTVIGDAKTDAVESIALEFSDLFARVNPKFDRDLFLAVVRGDKPVNARPSKKQPPALERAAQDVIDNWENGNLAESVQVLAEVLQAAQETALPDSI